jgi:pyrroline-5-carboxylate reductase
MTIGFIGAGKMARALAQGLVAGGVAKPGDLVCTSRTQESGRAFLELFPNGQARWLDQAAKVVAAGDPIILAIKPQQFGDVLAPLRDISAGKLFLSLAAGVTTAKIADALHPSARIVRCMPNTPMQVGAGASIYAPGANATTADLALVDQILSAAGRAWKVEENQIDALTALSGSGPAYVFHFIEALTRGAIALGIDGRLADELARQTVLGAAKLASESPLPPLDLAAQVKSPGGTTIAGCAILEQNDALNQLLAQCLAAAHARAAELGK